MSERTAESPCVNVQKDSNHVVDETILVMIPFVVSLGSALHFLGRTSKSSESRLEAKEESEGPCEQRTAPAAIRYDDLLCPCSAARSLLLEGGP